MLTIETLPIVVISLCIGLVGGFVMHRSDFCIAGMFRDLFLFRQIFMLRMLAVAVVISLCLFEIARLSGLLGSYPFPLIGSPSLANIAGSFLFGAGMVLAGGCVVGTLYKMGAGSLPALITFFGLVAGSVFYAEIHPFWKVFVHKTTVFQGNVTVSQLLGISPSVLVLITVIVALVYCYRHKDRLFWIRSSAAESYLQPWKAAVTLAVLGIVSYIFIGMPIGITTAYTKMGAITEALFVPEHVASLSYFKGVPLDYVPPFMEHSLRGGAGPGFDAISLIQFPLIFGIVMGAAFSAVRLGEFSLRWNIPVRQIFSAFLGGFIMGLACRMTPACNIWHLLGGLPVFALQSFLYLAGIIPGAWLGSRLLTRFVLR